MPVPLGSPFPLVLVFAAACAGANALGEVAHPRLDTLNSDGDVSAFIQRSSEYHPALGPCSKTKIGGTWGWFSDATKLKKVLDDTTAAVKMARGLLTHSQSQSQSHSRAQEPLEQPKTRARAKSKEGETRGALREQFRALLQHFPKISAGVRGVLTGWAVPQIMEWRRSSGPNVQALIDDIAGLGLFTSRAADLELKASQVAEALQRSGFGDLAANITVLLPSLRGISNAISGAPASARVPTAAAAVLHAMAQAQQSPNSTTTLGLPLPVLRFAADAAGLFEQGRSAGEIKDRIPGMAAQMCKELNVSVDARALSTLTEMVVGLTPRFMHGDLRVADIMPYLSRLLSDSQSGRQFKALPVIVEFLSDLSAMNEAGTADVDKGRVLSRLARFLSDLEVFDQVGGPLGAIAGLTSDLAQFASGSGGNHDERRAYLRFARLANELHLINESMGEGLATGFEGLAHASCGLLGPQAHSEVCEALRKTQGPEPGPGHGGGRQPEPVALLAMQGAPELEDDEAVGEVMGVLLSDASAYIGGPFALAQTHSLVQELEQGHGHGHGSTPTHSGIFSLLDPCAAPMPGSSSGSGDVGGTSKRRQSPEAKRREPATRTALREKLGTLLAKLPSSVQLPSMARGVIVNYLVPKLMEMRRESDPQVQELMDRAATLDFTALAPALQELGATLSSSGSGENKDPRDPARLAKLLQQSAQLAKLLGVEQQVTDFLVDLAHQVQSGHGDWADFVHSDAPERLVGLLRHNAGSDGSSVEALNTTAELLRSYQRGDDAATIIPKATRLVEELDLLSGPRRQGLATALDRAALLACASSALAPHMTLCHSAGFPGPEKVAPPPKVARNPAPQQPHPQLQPQPQVSWHRRHTER